MRSIIVAAVVALCAGRATAAPSCIEGTPYDREVLAERVRFLASKDLGGRTVFDELP